MELPPMGPREKMAFEASLYWLARRFPPTVAQGEGDSDPLIWIDFILAQPLEEQFRDDLEGCLYNPEVNPRVALIEALAILDGFLPNGLEKARTPKDRIKGKDLALMLNADSRKLAACLRWAGVEPRGMRFPDGVTKGYALRDVERGYAREMGDFLEKIEEIKKRRDLFSGRS